MTVCVCEPVVDPVSIGQKNVMTAICWMEMAAPRNATKRWASAVTVS